MPPSDSELLCAAQSGGEASKEAIDELPARFGGLLRHYAGRCCLNYGLDLAEIGDIINDVMVALLDPMKARFDPTRPGHVRGYIWGLVQNAARDRARFVRNGDDQRHDWADPQNVRLDLPTSVDEIHDPGVGQFDPGVRELEALVLASAGPELQAVIVRVVYNGETLAVVAASLGIDRTTVGRRLNQFYRLAAARWQIAMAG